MKIPEVVNTVKKLNMLATKMAAVWPRATLPRKRDDSCDSLTTRGKRTADAAFTSMQKMIASSNTASKLATRI
jgi:hypothetical protein